MQSIYLVRHAAKEQSIGDVPITDQGINQAQLTAAFFSGIPIAVIATSPLQRAKQTAEYIALASRSKVVVDNRLREHANWGDMPGQSFEDFISMWERCTREPDYIPPVGDSAKQAGERLCSCLLELASQHPTGSNLVAVAHGGIMTDFLVNYFSEQQLSVFHPDFIEEQSSLVPECSITQLTFDNTKFEMVTFASTDHLR